MSNHMDDIPQSLREHWEFRRKLILKAIEDGDTHISPKTHPDCFEHLSNEGVKAMMEELMQDGYGVLRITFHGYIFVVVRR